MVNKLTNYEFIPCDLSSEKERRTDFTANTDKIVCEIENEDDNWTLKIDEENKNNTEILSPKKDNVRIHLQVIRKKSC